MNARLPSVVIAKTDCVRLRRSVTGAFGRRSPVGAFLMSEMNRACLSCRWSMSRGPNRSRMRKDLIMQRQDENCSRRVARKSSWGDVGCIYHVDIDVE